MTSASQDIENLVREHRELFERIATSDLAIAEDAERALKLLGEGGENK